MEEGEVVPRGEAERFAAELETGQVDGAVEVEDDPAPLVARGSAADMEEDVQEEVKVQVRRALKEPTREERMRHEATHLPYRSWCPTCVRGRGRNAPHRRVVEREHDGVPKMCMDYFFLGSEGERADESPMIDDRRGYWQQICLYC